MFHALGRHAVRLAPEGQLDLSAGVIAGFLPDGFVDRAIARDHAGAWFVADQRTAQEHCAKHDLPPVSVTRDP